MRILLQTRKENHSPPETSADAFLISTMFLLKEKRMLQRGEQGPVAMFLRSVAATKFKMTLFDS